jgi:hypothetical protein
MVQKIHNITRQIRCYLSFNDTGVTGMDMNDWYRLECIGIDQYEMEAF